ncbi:MAG: hypothetical protein P8100_05230 [bacterium]|jgi:hypothetical protein
MKKFLFYLALTITAVSVVVYVVSCNKLPDNEKITDTSSLQSTLKYSGQGSPLEDKNFSSWMEEADLFYGEMLSEVSADQYVLSIESGDMNIIYNAMELSQEEISHYDTIFVYYAEKFLESNEAPIPYSCSLCSLSDEELVEVAYAVYDFYQENYSGSGSLFEPLVQEDGECDMWAYLFCAAGCAVTFGEWCPPCGLLCITWCMCEYCPSASPSLCKALSMD